VGTPVVDINPICSDVHPARILQRAGYDRTKRVVDFSLATTGLVVCAPLMVAIAAVIKLDSPGPVFYRGIRVGRFGAPFYMFKFRSMVADAERRGGSCTSDEDSRITRAGATLRKTKLDELPQLFNVLLGNMSLVGPRPEVKKFTDLFTDEERQILYVKPGITDWATLWDSDEGALLSGSVDPEQAYMELIRPTKISLQLKYVRKRSISTDIAILFQTVSVVLRRLFVRGKRASGTTPPC
jgi:lipopolysaccharide/colanic/teichoic acid biosynthesis glycosyltransferase